MHACGVTVRSEKKQKQKDARVRLRCGRSNIYVLYVYVGTFCAFFMFLLFFSLFGSILPVFSTFSAYFFANSPALFVVFDCFTWNISATCSQLTLGIVLIFGIFGVFDEAMRSSKSKPGWAMLDIVKQQTGNILLFLSLYQKNTF